MTHNNASAHSLQSLGASQGHEQDHKPPLRVLELFAGVGGFHLGLERVNQQRISQGLPRAFQLVWANQWEPGSKAQHAARVYEARWGLAPVNRDLFAVLQDEAELGRLHSLSPDMLVGGFPCQDFSVAKPLSQSQGLEGAKGVLWWGIHRLLDIRRQAGKPIRMVVLENVDRLLSSPGKCKGRDFATMLSSLQALGYATSWQVVNGADYGSPQRRRRIFMVAVHESSSDYMRWQHCIDAAPLDWLIGESPLGQAFPTKAVGELKHVHVSNDVKKVGESFCPTKKGTTPFLKSGVCMGGNVWTVDVRPHFVCANGAYAENVTPKTLGQVVAKTVSVAEKFFLDGDALSRWQHAKGSKSVARVSRSGHAYQFSEGALSFPDPLDKPSRTVLTSEVGASASRTRHVIAHSDGRLRRLTPEEVEELMGFSRGFTALPGISDTRRGFLMGNALLPGLVARLGQAILGQMTHAQSEVRDSFPSVGGLDESVIAAG
ncbi:MAG: DNA (cytosine-5-)-methyltransferase [Rhodoferax sp.]|uniref:DNA (cytosine-5-)-methyltransferase n=1 Tax=Rhodoferax sp. TaxID=50421 RepID=UPI0017D64094|nr:DNA (cytosine-5-)-methyltransferase [Rhodoferax sp.]NMM14212.1 DNA (cytosine-5-)-methyltransferase [Rhodoferax sp.]